MDFDPFWTYLTDSWLLLPEWMTEIGWNPRQYYKSITTQKRKFSTPKWAFITNHTIYRCMYVWSWIHLVQIICFAISGNEITSIKYSQNKKICKRISHKTKNLIKIKSLKLHPIVLKRKNDNKHLGNGIQDPGSRIQSRIHRIHRIQQLIQNLRIIIYWPI